MISVLMPIYNGSEFFEQSFNSILKQTFRSWELLIGVNGHESKSEIYQRIKLIVEEEERVKLFDFPEFRSKSKTLNRLRDCAQNEILCLLDVDDYWDFNKLEKQISFMNKYDIVGTGCQYFGDKKGFPNIPYGEISPEIFQFVNPIINSSSMFLKKDALWREGIEGVEDYDMWLRLNKENKKFFNIKEILCYHRIHKDSAFNTKNNSDIEKKIKNNWNL